MFMTISIWNLKTIVPNEFTRNPYWYSDISLMISISPLETSSLRK